MEKVNFEMIAKISSNVFEIDYDLINIDSSPSDIENWDSIHHLMFISNLEEELNIEINVDDFDQMYSIRAVLNLVNSRYTN